MRKPTGSPGARSKARRCAPAPGLYTVHPRRIDGLSTGCGRAFHRLIHTQRAPTNGKRALRVRHTVAPVARPDRFPIADASARDAGATVMRMRRRDGSGTARAFDAGEPPERSGTPTPGQRARLTHAAFAPHDAAMPFARLLALVTAAAATATVLAQGAPPSTDAGRAAAPARALRIIVDGSADSVADVVARLVAPRFGAASGKSTTVTTQAANAAEIVARAAPDGGTLLFAGPRLAIDAALRSASAVDPRKALAPISLVAVFPYVLIATTAVALDSVQDIVAIAKANPGRLAYASPGAGSGAHLAGELFKSATSIHLRHVPAASQAAALAELAAGRVQLAFVPLANAEPLLKAKTARAVAVTGSDRLARLPGVPTIQEEGVPGFGLVGWYGLLAPAGTPQSIVDRLNGELRAVMASAELRERIADAVSGRAAVTSPEAFRETITQEVAGWSRLARELSIRVE